MQTSWVGLSTIEKVANEVAHLVVDMDDNAYIQMVLICGRMKNYL